MLGAQNNYQQILVVLAPSIPLPREVTEQVCIYNKKIFKITHDLKTPPVVPFYYSILFLNFLPFILGSGFKCITASRIPYFQQLTCMGTPASLLSSTGHQINEKYLLAVGWEPHKSWLQWRNSCLQCHWLQPDIKPFISSLAVWT